MSPYRIAPERPETPPVKRESDAATWLVLGFYTLFVTVLMLLLWFNPPHNP